MVTYFNRKDLVDFGEYLFSEKRRKSFELTESEVPIEDRLKLIHKEDVDNWLFKGKKNPVVTISVTDLTFAQNFERKNVDKNSF